MRSRHDGHQLVPEQGLQGQVLAIRRVVDERKVERAVEERLDGVACRLREDLDFDAGERGFEALERRGEPVVAGVALRRDAQHALITRAELAEIVLQPRQLLDDCPSRPSHALPLARHGHARAVAAKQLHVQLRLQLAKAVAQRGLRDGQPARGGRHRAFLADRVDHDELRDRHMHMSIA